MWVCTGVYSMEEYVWFPFNKMSLLPGSVVTYTPTPNIHFTDTDVTLPDKLNTFFHHFEDNTMPPSRGSLSRTAPPSPFSVADVSKTFKCFNPRKSAGTDSIPCRVLRLHADQLARVFTDIFNQSLSQSVACSQES